MRNAAFKHVQHASCATFAIALWPSGLCTHSVNRHSLDKFPNQFNVSSFCNLTNITAD